LTCDEIYSHLRRQLRKFNQKTMKIRLLFTTLTIVSVVLLGGCRKDDFVENISACPVVISTSPASGQIGVPLIKIITATFNTKMDPSSITAVSFTVRDGASVAGSVTYQGQTASFTPAGSLTANTIYTGKVTTAVKDPYGNHMQEDYIWTFSTGTTPLVPYVVSTDPISNATNVPLAQVVTATFSEPMDPATITAAGTFTLLQGANPVAGTVTYNATTASFTPSANLATGVTYTARVTNAAENVGGVAMTADYVWNFSTGAVVTPTVIATDPTNFETNVAINFSPIATFSMPMDPLTMVAANYTLFDGAAHRLQV
jgi:Bacterial Ig-like domain